jgi:hypothetical protein
MWIYTATPPYAFMALCLSSQAQGQLYIYFLPLRYYGHLGSDVYQTTRRDIPEDSHLGENLKSHINCETSLGVCHQVVTYIVTSVESCWISFLTSDVNQKCHTGNIVEHIVTFFP